MNHAAAHKHYSYESWLRIWKPELFHILTQGASSSLLLHTEHRAWGAPAIVARPAIAALEILSSS